MDNPKHGSGKVGLPIIHTPPSLKSSLAALDRVQIAASFCCLSELCHTIVPGCPLPAGWSNTITVCAYVVNIRDAAAADKHGLLQPLLKRWQAGGLSYAAFALPAVQAVIGEGQTGLQLAGQHASLDPTGVHLAALPQQSASPAARRSILSCASPAATQTGSGAASAGACCCGSWPSSCCGSSPSSPSPSSSRQAARMAHGAIDCTALHCGCPVAALASHPSSWRSFQP